MLPRIALKTKPTHPESERSKEASILNGAKYTNISGGSFTINNYDSRGLIWWLLWLSLPCTFLASMYYKWGPPASLSTEPSASITRRSLDLLYDKVAVNAVSDKGGRAEDAKCHNGTREEVIHLIEQWMGTRNGRNGFLWLSGPAGAGKTAIMKTIAERAKERDVRTANFFFFRGDPTRNHAQPLVTTLVYQIIQLYAAARNVVAAILTKDPLILRMGINDQFNHLLFPLFDVIRISFPKRTPLVLLVDGLDECGVNDVEDAKRFQAQVLHALDNLVSQKDSPFVALVASRPEPHIRMAFNQLASNAQSIFLDHRFSPEVDIQRFVAAEFDKIKASHPSARLLSDSWPSKSAVDAIVEKSSGQFIYAATVMRFLAHASAVPSLSLDKILGIAPAGRNSPFIQLDSIYAYILGQVDDREAMRDILSAKLLDDATQEEHALCSVIISTTVVVDDYIDVGSMISHSDPSPPPSPQKPGCRNSIHYNMPPIKAFLSVYNPRYTDELIESCLSELAAIAQLQDSRLAFYHASLADFLKDESRSKNFHVDLKAFSKQVPLALLNGKYRSSMLRQGTAHPVTATTTVTAIATVTTGIPHFTPHPTTVTATGTPVSYFTTFF